MSSPAGHDPTADLPQGPHRGPADPSPERDPDGCQRIGGLDCFARGRKCPEPGWCPATQAAWDRRHPQDNDRGDVQ